MKLARGQGARVKLARGRVGTWARGQGGQGDKGTRGQGEVEVALGGFYSRIIL